MSAAFLGIAFVAGLLTVLAPCILPLLPVIVGGSVSGERSLARALRITGALGISVVAFTLLLKATAALAPVPPLAWQLLSGGLLIAFGAVTLFPGLWERLPGLQSANLGANRALSRGYMRGSVWGDVLVGVALGPVFTSCSPTYFIVLATVLPAHPVEGVVYLTAYAIGLSLALLCIAVAGQRILDSLNIASDPRGRFKRGVGALFVLVGIALVAGLDKDLAASLPQGAYGITALEQKLLSFARGAGAPEAAGAPSARLTPEEKARMFAPAPELVSPDAYLNTGGDPITIGQFKGKKVVLVDFWTYSCINCQRTLPYLEDWYGKYKDQGLVVIGVHTPEFSFEHVQQNVAQALKSLGVTYPVVLDNEYRTWNAFGNEFWPHKYLIDIDGYVVYDHAGEGDYGEAEAAIQAALAERADRLGLAAPEASTTAPAPAPEVGSPETYFGAARNDYLYNGAQHRAGSQTLALPSAPARNALYLGGAWDIEDEYAQGVAGSEVAYRFAARRVYLVAEADAPADVEVWQDGALVRTVRVAPSQLYTLIDNAAAGEHTLKLVLKGAARLYTFTFG